VIPHLWPGNLTTGVATLPYLDVKFVLGGHDEAGEFDDPQSPVFVVELAVDADALPRPHVTTATHVLAHHEVVREPPTIITILKQESDDR